MKLVFINSEPRDPLPDLLELFFEHCPKLFDADSDDCDVKFLSLNAKADGTLHQTDGVTEGTLAKATIIQTGIYQHDFNENSNVAEGDPHFPAERIAISAVG
jgi:hypothetical protein